MNKCTSIWFGVGATRQLLSTTTIWAHVGGKYFGQLGNYHHLKKDLGNGIGSVITMYLMLSTTGIETCGLATGIPRM